MFRGESDATEVYDIIEELRNVRDKMVPDFDDFKFILNISRYFQSRTLSQKQHMGRKSI